MLEDRRQDITDRRVLLPRIAEKHFRKDVELVLRFRRYNEKNWESIVC
jgi:hypothetical protein